MTHSSGLLAEWDGAAVQREVFSRDGPYKPSKELGFTGCGKKPALEGYGLQAVRKYSERYAALAAEGRDLNPSEVVERV